MSQSALEHGAKAVRAVQDEIDEIQQELHHKVSESDGVFDEQKNAVYAARQELIEKLMAEDKLPATFWADALIALLKRRDAENDEVPHFLGPYDEHLLRHYLRDIAVEHKGSRTKTIRLHFRPNPFFEEAELWARCDDLPLELNDEKDEEDADDEEEDEDFMDERWTFSGITWKEGHGPEDAEDYKSHEEEPEEAERHHHDHEKTRPHEGGGAAAEGGQHQQQHAHEAEKRHRDGAEAEDEKKSTAATMTTGPSMLEVFSIMPPHPTLDDDLAEEDEDVLAEEVHHWEEEMQDRRLLLEMLIEDLFVDPCTALSSEAADLSHSKEGEGESGEAKEGEADDEPPTKQRRL